MITPTNTPTDSEVAVGVRHCWLIERLREYADIAGTRPAVVGDESLDYASLILRINETAQLLRGQGVGPGHRVAIDRGAEAAFIVDFAAVLDIGATAVPLDPSVPAARRTAILEQARPSFVLGGTEAGPREGAEASDPTAAYVLFTSGTTGRPKGVEVSTVSLDAYVRASLDVVPAGPGDVVVFSHSTGFDFSQWDIWTALASGATLAVPPAETVRDPWSFADFLRQHAVTHWGPAPTQFRAYLTYCPEMADAAAQLSVLLFAGEALPRDVLKLAQNVVGKSTRIFNAYGITETTVFNLCIDVTHDRAETPVDLGDPIGANRWMLRDEHGEIVPDGCTGVAELLLAGPQLATRYVGREDLTRKRFVNIEGTRMYVTGDLVRRGADGRLTFVSRLDDQIKLNGFRIELEEVKAALTAHPEVKSACVFVIGRDLKEELIAVLRCDSRPRLRDELVDSLAERLPRYMIPTQFVRWDEIAWPTTPNGKEDVSVVRDRVNGLENIR